MSGIQKRGSASIAVDWSHGHDDGPYVTYADHVAAVAEAEQRLDEAWERLSAERVAQAVRDERARIRKAVQALPHDTYCAIRDDNYLRPCNCLRGDVLAVITNEAAS